MSNHLKEHDLKYILGHTFKTNLVGQTYQPSNWNVDTTSLRYSAAMESNISMIKKHSSVLYHRTKSVVPALESITNEMFKQDAQIMTLATTLLQTQELIAKAEHFRRILYDDIIQDDKVSNEHYHFLLFTYNIHSMQMMI